MKTNSLNMQENSLTQNRLKILPRTENIFLLLKWHKTAGNTNPALSKKYLWRQFMKSTYIYNTCVNLNVFGKTYDIFS